jgi:hypothetical protein
LAVHLHLDLGDLVVGPDLEELWDVEDDGEEDDEALQSIR